MDTLYAMLLAQLNGDSIPSDFNASATVFVPKGNLDADQVEVVREGTDMRPLSLKNTDNKINVSTVNRTLRPVIQEGTHETQNGFVPERQLIQNAVDIDTHGRVFAMKAQHHNMSASHHCSQSMLLAIYAFFYFCVAFPSVAHEWMQIIITLSGAPKWLSNFMDQLYSNNKTYHMTSEGKHSFMTY